MANDCEFRPECKIMLDDIRDEVVTIRKAVLGNGGVGIKDKVAMHGLSIKIIGAVSLAALGGLIGLVVRLIT